MSVKSENWNYFNRFDTILDEFMPDVGEGDTMASQAVTAVNKIVYKWYNDGDVYDNTYGLVGWVNDLSSYANWLNKYIPYSRTILSEIENCRVDDEYENILVELADTVLDRNLLNKLNTEKAGSIYDCDGPFKFVDTSEVEEEGEDYFDEDDE